MSELRKYGALTTILFPLIDRDAVDFESTPVTFVAADTQISKDEGAFANTGATPAHEGNGVYSLALTATEMEAARIMITCIDAATKTWEDQAIIIDTYGNASAQHAFDLDVAEQDVNLVKWRGDVPALLYASYVTANIRAIRDDTDMAAKLENLLIAMQPLANVFQAGSTTTSLVLAASESSVDDFYNGMLVFIYDGVAINQSRRIVDYEGSTRTATLDSALVTSAPASGDIYLVINGYDLVGLGAQEKLDVNAEADTALTDYDAPTKAEMDTGHGLLATEAKQDTIDTVVDAIKAIADLLPNAGALNDLAIILADTGELQADDIPGLIASLNDPTAVAIANAVLRQPTSSVEASWTEDHRTLYGVIAALMHKAERRDSDTIIRLYKADDSTTLVDIPITKDSGLDPISIVDPPA